MSIEAMKLALAALKYDALALRRRGLTDEHVP